MNFKTNYTPRRRPSPHHVRTILENRVYESEIIIFERHCCLSRRLHRPPSPPPSQDLTLDVVTRPRITYLKKKKKKPRVPVIHDTCILKYVMRVCTRSLCTGTRRGMIIISVGFEECLADAPVKGCVQDAHDIVTRAYTIIRVR